MKIYNVEAGSLKIGDFITNGKAISKIEKIIDLDDKFITIYFEELYFDFGENVSRSKSTIFAKAKKLLKVEL